METVLTNYLVENELITVELTQIDVIHNTLQFTESLEAYLIRNEVPTKLNATTFQTANNYIAGSLKVSYNGLDDNLNELSDNTFSLNIDTIVGDTIKVSYIKQA